MSLPASSKQILDVCIQKTERLAWAKRHLGFTRTMPTLDYVSRQMNTAESQDRIALGIIYHSLRAGTIHKRIPLRERVESSHAYFGGSSILIHQKDIGELNSIHPLVKEENLEVKILGVEVRLIATYGRGRKKRWIAFVKEKGFFGDVTGEQWRVISKLRESVFLEDVQFYKGSLELAA